MIRLTCLVGLIRTLSAAGLPVPGSVVVSDPADMSSLVRARPRFAKPVFGSHSDAVRLLSAGDTLPRDGGPWLLQDAVPGPGYVYKVYVVGQHAAVVRAGPRDDAGRRSRQLVSTPASSLIDIARAVGRACDLTCYGVDLVPAPDGPVVIDVNPFPGFRGLTTIAAPWVADTITSMMVPVDRPPPVTGCRVR